jgi:transcriptional regulator of acetoin/glycerol metabolism
MWQNTLTELRRFADALPVNILILGAVTSEQRDEALFELRAAHGRDASHPQRTMPFTLPRIPNTIVVIEEIADLSTDHQQMLHWWLDRHREGMVLSFAVNPVFPLVSRGVFSEKLFYRLNMITLSVDEQPA